MLGFLGSWHYIDRDMLHLSRGAPPRVGGLCAAFPVPVLAFGSIEPAHASCEPRQQVPEP